MTVSTFRQRVLARETLVGTFMKTPTSHGTEIIGALGFDFVIIDQEHSPFDRASIDMVLLAARAHNIPALVRVQGPETILSVLDSGATGVLVPHVVDADYARKVAGLCRYKGGRGFATSTRAGDYTAVPMWKHIEKSDNEIVVVAQIEDPPALDHLDAIAAVEGIDSLFIGRGDLTAAFGDQQKDPPGVRDASERTAAAALKAKKCVSVFTGGGPETTWLQSLGASMFVLASDQSFLRNGAAREMADLRKILASAKTGA